MTTENDHSYSTGERIDALTPEQAIRACGLFYDLLPASLWEGEQKPPLARIETLADQMQESAGDDVAPVLDTLLGEGNAAAKGEVSRFLLHRFAQDDALRPHVEQAVARAVEPHMMIDPVTLGIVVVALAVLSTSVDVHKTKKGTKLSIKGRAPELVHELAGLVKDLPKSLLEALGK